MADARKREGRTACPAGIVGEYLTIPEVARLLHRRTTVIREYATRREDPLPFRIFEDQGKDPLPFRIFEDQGKGPLIHRDDLRDWWVRNTVVYGESPAAKLSTVYKRSSHGERF